MSDSFFSMFQALIGAYLLYCGITGKGQAYKADNIKEDQQPRFLKFMRLFCLIMGPLALISALFEYLVAQTPSLIIGVYISYGLFAAGIIYAIVVTARMTNRPPRKASKKDGKK